MRRPPVGLTLAAAVGVAILVGLGAWQLTRLAQKSDLLARIAALQHAPPRPIGPVLAAMRRGDDVGYLRVTLACAPGPATAPTYRYALRDGRVGWRLMSPCPLSQAPYAGMVLDRGLVDRFAGQMSPSAANFPAPVQVTGVLRHPGVRSLIDAAPRRLGDGATVLQAVDPAALRAIGGVGVAPYYLAVESEEPRPPGVTPAALPQDIPNNHLVYALTWFGLAGVLISTWAGMVWRRSP